MIITWNDHSVRSVHIDGKNYANRAEIELEKGIHKAEICLSGISVNELRKKILRNWFSVLFGIADDSLDVIYKDTYDRWISFKFSTVEGASEIDVDEMLSGISGEIAIKRKMDHEKYKTVSCLFTAPICILCFLVFAVFLVFGLIAFKNNNIGAGIISEAVAAAFLLMVIGILVKLKRKRLI